jgi:hypothetical protein
MVVTYQTIMTQTTIVNNVPAFDLLKPLVMGKLEAYKNDFLDYDRKSIEDHPNAKLILVAVRDTGTNMYIVDPTMEKGEQLPNPFNNREKEIEDKKKILDEMKVWLFTHNRFFFLFFAGKAKKITRTQAERLVEKHHDGKLFC